MDRKTADPLRHLWCDSLLVKATYSPGLGWTYQGRRLDSPFTARRLYLSRIAEYATAAIEARADFDVSAVALAAPTLAQQVDAVALQFEQALEEAWVLPRAGLVEALALDESRWTNVILLPRYEQHHRQVTPWGRLLAELTVDVPQAQHGPSGLTLLGAGPCVTTWIYQYFATVTEKSPAHLPLASSKDTTQLYQVVASVWSPEAGTLSGLDEAFEVARGILA